MANEEKKVDPRGPQCNVCGGFHGKGPEKWKHGVQNWWLYFLRAPAEQLQHFEQKEN